MSCVRFRPPDWLISLFDATLHRRVPSVLEEGAPSFRKVGLRLSGTGYSKTNGARTVLVPWDDYAEMIPQNHLGDDVDPDQ